MHIQQQHEEFEQQNKRNRYQKMISRRAHKTAIQQRNLNPVLDLVYLRNLTPLL